LRTQKTREEVKKAVLDNPDLIVDSIQELLDICCPSNGTGVKVGGGDCAMCAYASLCIDESTPKEKKDGTDEVIPDGTNQ
jgi:uncharacterized Fe-S cluster-containing MiaB family protein